MCHSIEHSDFFFVEKPLKTMRRFSKFDSLVRWNTAIRRESFLRSSNKKKKKKIVSNSSSNCLRVSGDGVLRLSIRYRAGIHYIHTKFTFRAAHLNKSRQPRKIKKMERANILCVQHEHRRPHIPTVYLCRKIILNFKEIQSSDDASVLIIKKWGIEPTIPWLLYIHKISNVFTGCFCIFFFFDLLEITFESALFDSIWCGFGTSINRFNFLFVSLKGINFYFNFLIHLGCKRYEICMDN